MAIRIGDTLPDGTLTECTGFDAVHACPTSPEPVDVVSSTAGKKIVLFGVPGAFTPTCSLKHLPGYIDHYDALSAAGIDEIWCMAVNDAYVMGAWAHASRADGKVRLLADGSADYARKLGLERDLSANGMGIRCYRFAMIVDNGVVSYLGVEASGKFEVSHAEAILAALK